MNLTNRNIIANFGNRLWGFISLYLFTPFYIQFLGIEKYALISFYTVLFGFISFADVGISSSITREFAKGGSDEYKHGSLIFFERIYALICIALGTSIVFLAPIISSAWLKATIPAENLVFNIRLIGIGISLQLMSSIYYGALMGLQKQVKANILQTVWSLVRAGGVVVVLYFKPSLTLFFCWTVGCNILYLMFLRSAVIGSLNPGAQNADIRPIKPEKAVWTYIGGMALIAILSSTNLQIDKLVASKLFRLSEFGYYSLSAILAQIPVIIATPIVIAIFPLMTRAVSEAKKHDLSLLYRRYSFLVSCIVIPIGIITALYSRELFLLWLSRGAISPDEIVQVSILIKILVIGNSFMALQLVPFYFMLANGETRFAIYQGVFQIAFTIPALYFFVDRYGLTGVGIPWLIVNIQAYIFFAYRISKSHSIRFDLFFTGPLLPLTINILIAGGLYYLCSFLPQGPFILLYGGAMFMAGFFSCILVHNKINVSEPIKMNAVFKRTGEHE